MDQTPGSTNLNADGALGEDMINVSNGQLLSYSSKAKIMNF